MKVRLAVARWKFIGDYSETDNGHPRGWKLFGFACRSNESKTNETGDYRRNVNLLRDTCDCDGGFSEKGKRKPRIYLSFCHVDDE